jgi:TonB family protein
MQKTFFSTFLTLVLVTFCCIQMQAQDSINYNGRKVPVYKLKDKNYVIVGADTSEVVIEAYPEYPGGKQALATYLSQHVTYPKTARKDKVSGNVVVNFVITTQGNIDSVTVAQSVREDLDAEAVRVIRNMPPWKPATQNGKPVNARLSLPINFRAR